ncbi:MAG TPA: hypothetical protein VH702_17795 [Vicinamibacterales bacterium]
MPGSRIPNPESQIPSLTCVWLLAAAVGVFGQFSDAFKESRDHPTIEYSTRETTDPIATLNGALRAGKSKLAFESPRGYLDSLLKVLDVPVESQTLVFSETSFEPEDISPSNPRALYFNDRVAVGWVPGRKTLEIAAHDAQQGVIFYTLEQSSVPIPQFARNQRCLLCHLTSSTSGVPGLVTMSMLPLSDNPNEYAQGWPVDHRTPIEDRFGGWYVTGANVPRVHLGNVPVHHVKRSYTRLPTAPVLASLSATFDTTTYLSPHSDIVAQLVLQHQVQMTNLLTRLGWESRVAGDQTGNAQARVTNVVREFVDYLFFVDEAPLPSPVRGSAGFPETFAAAGPRDQKGRSLRDLDLERRLFRYPCSYLIYSPAFDALPKPAKDAVYQRMWDILSGRETDKIYARLTRADRQAIVEILRETKNDLPSWFRS